MNCPPNNAIRDKPENFNLHIFYNIPANTLEKVSSVSPVIAL